MRLSIITINLNNAEGVRKTVQSVLGQTFLDFEFIIIDGKSQDGSVSVVEGLLRKEHSFPVYFISEPDSGIYNAMNKGIAMSKGEYLLFLNSGDYLVNSNVLEQVFINKCYSDLLCCRCEVSEKGRVVWTSKLVPQKITLAWLYWNGLMHQSTFIRRDLFERIGMYDESFKWLADTQFWYKALIFHDASSQPIDVVTSNYNLEGVSSTTKNNELFDQERHWAFRQPVLRHVMPDFCEWEKDWRIANEYGWINEHRLLRKGLSFLRKVYKKVGRH